MNGKEKSNPTTNVKPTRKIPTKQKKNTEPATKDNNQQDTMSYRFNYNVK